MHWCLAILILIILITNIINYNYLIYIKQNTVLGPSGKSLMVTIQSSTQSNLPYWEGWEHCISNKHWHHCYCRHQNVPVLVFPLPIHHLLSLGTAGFIWRVLSVSQLFWPRVLWIEYWNLIKRRSLVNRAREREIGYKAARSVPKHMDPDLSPLHLPTWASQRNTRGWYVSTACGVCFKMGTKPSIW